MKIEVPKIQFLVALAALFVLGTSSLSLSFSHFFFLSLFFSRSLPSSHWSIIFVLVSLPCSLYSSSFCSHLFFFCLLSSLFCMLSSFPLLLLVAQVCTATVVRRSMQHCHKSRPWAAIVAGNGTWLFFFLFFSFFGWFACDFCDLWLRPCILMCSCLTSDLFIFLEVWSLHQTVHVAQRAVVIFAVGVVRLVEAPCKLHERKHRKEQNEA